MGSFAFEKGKKKGKTFYHSVLGRAREPFETILFYRRVQSRTEPTCERYRCIIVFIMMRVCDLRHGSFVRTFSWRTVGSGRRLHNSSGDSGVYSTRSYTILL